MGRLTASRRRYPSTMATFVRDPEPIELEQLRERRERLELDRHDEVWEGVLPQARSAPQAIRSQVGRSGRPRLRADALGRRQGQPGSLEPTGPGDLGEQARGGDHVADEVDAVAAVHGGPVAPGGAGRVQRA